MICRQLSHLLNPHVKNFKAQKLRKSLCVVLHSSTVSHGLKETALHLWEMVVQL